ncbi:MAG: molecular chaperone DnaJ [Myxococcales bacterium]|nr:MAG: molecular chaperone DnaJ [Myxococcales bacterium]
MSPNPDWANKDFYKVLGVAKDADQAAIKKAYRALSKQYHPDSRPGDSAAEAKFKEVAEAYGIVGNDAKRKEYDEFRAAVGSGGFGGGFPGFGQGQPGAGAGGFDISDLFGGLFGDRGGAGGGFGGARTRAPRPSRGADLEATTTIGFTEALEGTTISLRLASDAPCQTCNGTGGKPGTRPHICPTCEGSGAVLNSMGGFATQETCPECHGRQLVYDDPCPACRGSGRGTSDRAVQARIPAGVKDGQRIRLRGKGAAGDNGGHAGDLYVTVKVRTHPVFARKGDALTVTVPVTFDEAALGAEIKVPTLGGAPVTVKVPAGTPTGRVMRVRGRGVARKDGTKGDLLVTLDVQVPPELTDETRAAIEAYRAARAGADPRAKLFEAGA